MHDVAMRILKRRLEHVASMIKAGDADRRDLESALRRSTGKETEALDELKDFVEDELEELTELEDELGGWIDELGGSEAEEDD